MMPATIDKRRFASQTRRALDGSDHIPSWELQVEPAANESRSTSRPASILLAEDDDEMRAVLAFHLRKEGYLVTQCRNGIELADRTDASLNPRREESSVGQHYDLVITDIRMPGILGISVLEGCQHITNAPPIILITAFGDAETHAEAERLGAAAFFDKPFEICDLVDKVRQILSSDGTRQSVVHSGRASEFGT